MIKKKVLIVTVGDLPSKNEGASTVLFFYYINFFLNNAYKVYLLSFQEKKNKQNITHTSFVKKFIKKKNLIFNKVVLDKIYNSNKYNFFFKGINTSDFSTEIKEKILKFNPDEVFALDIAAVSFVNKLFLPTKKLYAWLGDLNFSTTYYHYYYDLKFNYKKIFKLPFIFYLIHKWKIFYKENLNKFKILSGSNTNLSHLKKINIKSIYLPYPWPKQFSYLKINKFKKPSFIFFGNLQGLGSKSAVNNLLNKIYPSYTKVWGENGFTIYICGFFNLDKNILNKINNLKNIKYLGFKKNINKIALKCHACLFPIDVPLGNRSRIVTALANRWPIIAHKNVGLGNPDLKSDYNCLLAKNDNQFIVFSKKIFRYTNLSKKITKNGFKTYNKKFKPVSALRSFKKFINA